MADAESGGAISSGGATSAPVPPRAQTAQLSGLFLRVDPSCPLCVYMLRASEELSTTTRDHASSVALYNPFVVPCKGANRSVSLAKVVKAQTGQSATALIEGRGGAFEVISIPLPGSPTEFNVYVVQIDSLNAVNDSLTLATLEFNAHHEKMRELYAYSGPARRVDADLIAALAVDKLASVPVVNLVAAADAVARGVRSVEILDYHDAPIPVHGDFLRALPLLKGALLKALARFGGGDGGARSGAGARPLSAPTIAPRAPEKRSMDVIGTFVHPRKGSQLVISIGNYEAAHNLTALRAAGITHIVNCFVSDLSPGHFFGLDGRSLKCCGADAARNSGETCKPRHWTPFPDDFEYACVVRVHHSARTPSFRDASTIHLPPLYTQTRRRSMLRRRGRHARRSSPLGLRRLRSSAMRGGRARRRTSFFIAWRASIGL